MKIGYICSDVDVQLLGHHGCSVHIREFTGALVDAGHDVFVICNWLGESKHIHPKARVYRLDSTGLNRVVRECLTTDPVIRDGFLDRDFGSILWNNWLQIDGANILEREKPDILYERYALFGFGASELRRRFAIPWILELNAPLCDQQEGYEKFPLLHTARELEPKIICSADAVVALTPWLADWAVRLGAERDKIHILPDAVSRPLFSRNLSGQAIRAEFNLTNSQVVGFVGSFHKWHDVAGLLQVFAKLLAADPTRRLILVGDGHDRKKLEKKARSLALGEAVTFIGKVPHDRVPEFIAAMDVAVVPYEPIREFFFSPMKLFESMAAGCPTVAADLGQISQVVRHKETGWLYRPGDIEELAEGIETLLTDREMAARIGASARRYVLDNHTWDHVASEVVRIAKLLMS